MGSADLRSEIALQETFRSRTQTIPQGNNNKRTILKFENRPLNLLHIAQER